MNSSHIEKFADVVACLIKAPRTVPELAEVTGVSPDAIRRHVAALEGEGLVSVTRLPRPKTRGGNSRIEIRWAA